jgi:Fic family protein
MAKLMWDEPQEMGPLLPTLNRKELEERAWLLTREAASLGAALPEASRTAVTAMLRIVNSYYSNRIEGHSTLPIDIERAYRRDYSNDPARRDLQIEAKAHVEVHRRMRLRLAAELPQAITSPEFLQWLHRSFYAHLPKSMWVVRNDDTGEQRTVVPGEFRSGNVCVGEHEPPAYSALPAFLNRFAEAYEPSGLGPIDRIIAAAASHHRLLWIHPFFDGNGRVTRLFTEAYLARADVDSAGLWSISRGLARAPAYKTMLAKADMPRQGDLDGRANLSDRALGEFCLFFLDTALDQVRYIAKMLDLDGLRQRIIAYTQMAAGRGEIPKGSEQLLLQTLMRGSLERGEALEIIGGAERTARKHLSRLLDVGLVAPTSLTHRSGIRWSIPIAAAPSYFPDIYPADLSAELKSPNEITFVDRLRSLSNAELTLAIDDILSENVGKLEEDESVSSAMAMTNATGFGVDDYQFRIEDLDLFDDNEARVYLTFHLSGEHDWDSDRMYSGDEIEGSAVLVVEDAEHAHFEEVEAGRVEYPEEQEPE